MIEETLHARVARGVQLADVEQQRDALELGDRELAQPLFVEQRQGADAHPFLVEHRGLHHDVVVGLRVSAEHDDRRAELLGPARERVARRHARRRCSRPASANRRRGRVARARGRARRRAIPTSLWLRDDNDTVTLCCTRARRRERDASTARTTARGSTALPSTTKRGRSASPANELQHRDRDGGRRGGTDRGRQRRPAGSRLIGKSDAVRGHREEQHVPEDHAKRDDPDHEYTCTTACALLRPATQIAVPAYREKRQAAHALLSARIAQREPESRSVTTWSRSPGRISSRSVRG